MHPVLIQYYARLSGGHKELAPSCGPSIVAALHERSLSQSLLVRAFAPPAFAPHDVARKPPFFAPLEPWMGARKPGIRVEVGSKTPSL